MQASVTHIQQQDNHAVFVAALRVLIQPDTQGLWFAQGIEIDFAASGTSLDDVKRRFVNGLRETIHGHLEKFGKIDKLLRFAPEEAWKPLLEAKDVKLTLATLHTIPEWDQNLVFPFKEIAYYQKAA
ncbi:MAG: hypothetical protein ACREVY_13645 [Gammaproteobacteria bacterium]